MTLEHCLVQLAVSSLDNQTTKLHLQKMENIKGSITISLNVQQLVLKTAKTPFSIPTYTFSQWYLKLKYNNVNYLKGDITILT